MKQRLPALTSRVTVRGELKLSPVCLGMTDNWRVVGAAFEAGINAFFLSADMHWPLYEGLRKGLKDLLKVRSRRDEIALIATAYVTQPDFCTMPFQEVLQAIPGARFLDILCAGGAYADDFTERWPVYLAHRAAQYAGCRAVAASFHDRPLARVALKQRTVDLAFVRYNAGHPGAVDEVFKPLARTRTPPVYSFKTMTGWVDPERLHALGLEADRWVPSATDHYRFVLSTPGIAGVLASFEHPREVHQLADALTAAPLDANERNYMIWLSKTDAAYP